MQNKLPLFSNCFEKIAKKNPKTWKGKNIQLHKNPRSGHDSWVPYLASYETEISPKNSTNYHQTSVYILKKRLRTIITNLVSRFHHWLEKIITFFFRSVELITWFSLQTRVKMLQISQFDNNSCGLGIMIDCS